MRQCHLISLPLLLLLGSSAWADSMRSVIKDEINVRSGPGTDNQILFKVNRGYPLQVEKSSGAWLYVKDWEGDHGWIYKSLTDSIKTAVITKSSVNIRKGPTTGETIVATANRGDIFKVTAEKNGWLQLAFYDDGHIVGWVRNDLAWGP